MRVALICQPKDPMRGLVRALEAQGHEARFWQDAGPEWGAEQILLRFRWDPLVPNRILSLRRRTGAQVNVVASLDAPPAGRLGRLLSLAPHGLLIQAVLRVADRVFFDSETAWTAYQELLPGNSRRFFYLPLGCESEELVKPSRAEGAGRVLLQLASCMGESEINHSLEALQQALSALGKNAVTLWLPGLNESEVERTLQRLERGHLRGQVRGGESPAQADVVLAPFERGISTRESEVMSALAQGRPVVATRGPSTDPSPDWESFVELVPASDRELFARSVLRLLSDTGRAQELSRSAHRYYEENFAWSVAASRVLQAFEGHSPVVTPLKRR